ncbi:MAG: NosD domain-containing protein [Methanothrix sp.]|nr:NosD domain-containing protein [Methanothrix sp.]
MNVFEKVIAGRRAYLYKFLLQWALVAIICVCGSAHGATITLGLGGSIQGAIDAASPGDVIEVHSGTYHENVIVSKPIILLGVDTGEGKPVVDCGGKGSAILLSSSGSVLEGFVFTNSGKDINAGIRVISDRNVIRDNLVKDNNGYGIILENSSHNIITHIEFSGNLRGIGLFNSSNNVLFLNVFKDNGANVISSNSTNQWSSTDPITYRYKGRTLTDRLGNYWSGYHDPDLNDNGIGDVPHLFEHERDDSPLIITGLRPDIIVDKVANVSSGEPGTVVKFTIKVANIGDIEFDRVAVQDLLPDGLEYLGDNRSGTVQGSNVTWDIGSLTVGESKHLELTARISGTAIGNITNHARATGVLSREYSLTDEDAEVLEALIQRVMLTEEAEFSQDVIYVVPPPSAVSGETTGNLLSIIPPGSGGPGDLTAQQAIGRSKPGDIIELHGWDGNENKEKLYQENVIVDRQLTLRGVDIGNGLPILCPPSGSGTYYGTPMALNADGCVIESLILENSGDNPDDAGIIIASNGNVVRDNIIRNNNGSGIILVSASGNTITGNRVENNAIIGISLGSSSGNVIYFNNFENSGNSSGTNRWSSPAPITYRYNGTPSPTTWETTGLTMPEAMMTVTVLMNPLITMVSELSLTASQAVDQSRTGIP